MLQRAKRKQWKWHANDSFIWGGAPVYPGNRIGVRRLKKYLE